MSVPQTDTRRRYARRSDVSRVIAAARDSGIDVAAVQVEPDGTIKIFDARVDSGKADDEFGRWDAAGRL